MPRAPKSKPLELVELIDLETQLARDAALDRQTLRERDRRVALEATAAEREDRLALFRRWLERMRRDGDPLPGPSYAGMLRLARVILFGLGAFAGISAATGLLWYDGETPINVVHLIAFFVGLQALLLLFSIIVLLPGGLTGWIPGFRATQEALQLISPGRWIGALTRWLPGERKAALGAVSGRLKAYDKLYRGVRVALTAGLAQNFSVAFHLGALLCALSLIAFDDLAFGWRTTLALEPERLNAWCQAVAAPWSGFLPVASPSPELIEATRFVRGAADEFDYKASRAWWPFVAMMIFTYGLLPRLILWGVCGLYRRTALARLRLDHAGFQQLYDRLNAPLTQSRAESPESIDHVPTFAPAPKPEVSVKRKWAESDSAEPPEAESVKLKPAAAPATPLAETPVDQNPPPAAEERASDIDPEPDNMAQTEAKEKRAEPAPKAPEEPEVPAAAESSESDPSPRSHSEVTSADPEPAPPVASPVAPVASERSIAAPPAPPLAPKTKTAGKAMVVRWCGVELAAEPLRHLLRLRMGKDLGDSFDAGGIEFDGDTATLEAARRLRDGAAIAILAKSWESPTRDFINFLRDMREATGDGPSIVVIPVEPGDNCVYAPDPVDWTQWDTKVSAIGDPWTRVDNIGDRA